MEQQQRQAGRTPAAPTSTGSDASVASTPLLSGVASAEDAAALQAEYGNQAALDAIAAQGAAGPAAGGGGDWPTLLPRVSARDARARRSGHTGVTRVRNDVGQKPAMSYVDGSFDVSETGALDAEIDACIAGIEAARNSIPARPFANDPFAKKGNVYYPQRDDAPRAKEYNAWRNSATPTRSFNPDSPADQKKLAIFKRLVPLEGNEGTITTFDNTLSTGVGFSSAGTQAEQVISRAFNLAPEMAAVGFSAGLAARGRALDVVDTDKKWILSGVAASNYIQTDARLLSLFVNISQGVQPDVNGELPSEEQRDTQRTAWEDAQWQVFNDNAIANIPPSILGWPLDAAALAVHARHALEATFPWSFWEAQPSTDVHSLVRALYLRLKAEKREVWMLPICGGEYRSVANAVIKEEQQRAWVEAQGTPGFDARDLGLEGIGAGSYTSYTTHRGTGALLGVRPDGWMEVVGGGELEGVPTIGEGSRVHYRYDPSGELVGFRSKSLAELNGGEDPWAS